ncbi:MAG: PBP1A family penicillin-binding protein [Firmicutes bacterium]|nr:PBP1A family penicillin-binding protein [Bacillota bacterium]
MPHKAKKRSMRRPKKGIRWGYILLFLLIVIMIAALIGGVMGAGWIAGLRQELPEITADDLQMNQTSYVYDKTGRQIGTLHAGENRVTVELADMPPFLIDALIATEDIRFYEHNGVDFRSVMRALVVDARDSLKNKELTFTQGASTITMQLIRNVVADTQKKLDRKVKEALLALEFEKSYSKDDILYLYMNEIYLGQRTYGFHSAANYYFAKDLKDISLSEAALMVGVLRNAEYYSPYRQPERALGVRNTVLNNLIIYNEEKYGAVARAAMKEELVLSKAPDNIGTDYMHPWFVDNVLTEATNILLQLDMPAESLFTAGLHVYTTLYPKVQVAMENAYADDENFKQVEGKTGDIVESGMAIVNPHTGEICGLVGGRRYGAKRGFNRATSSQRQPGSSIKPVVAYGPALDLGYGPGFVLDDAPFTGAKYDPGNSDRAYQGRVTMRRALMGSRNTCAVRMLQTIGTQTGWSYAVNMGLPLSEEDAYYSSIALGGITRGVSPLDMAGAFATFANGGIYTKPYSVAKILDARGNIIYEADPLQRVVMSEQAAYLLTDMLISAVAGGTGTAARLSDWPTAGKTGTVELPSDVKEYAGKSGHKDIWFAGYTPELCGAVWMGYDNMLDAEKNVQYLPRVYGGGPTAQLWKVIMTACHEGMEVTQFKRPEGLAAISIDTKSGKLPSALTPPEFLGSELFDNRYVPTEESDIWQVVELCADSETLAGEYCPNKITSVRMVVDLEEGKEISTKVADYYLYAPQAYCTLHTVPQGDLYSVYICTDPRHGAERVLANVPAYGMSGGCPQEFIALRYYGAAYLPSKICDLTDHALEGFSQGVLDTNPTNPYLPANSVNTDNNQGTNLGIITDTNHDTNYGTTSGNTSGSIYPTDENGVPVLQTPNSLAVFPSGKGCLLSWAGHNDPATTIYIIQKVTDDEEETAIKYQVTGAYSFDDDDVRLGHTYTYRLYAYNAEFGVTSGWSQRINFSI